ncbi:S53 family peptidase [Streptomyces sp. NY05-11A]|uniref:S53 family peptidase n=1 Tax=Streptomyces soliscabiei TaxID=588897 RepID=UPI0029B56090|nr:S53 family peptidase [Streptomyces sp. NY05-11A]MDX2678171.1 S53 family peptidase [Streptomyces sp. NY05-11A]
MTEYAPIPGSERSAAPKARSEGPLDAATPVEATIVLRRRAEVPRDLIVGPETISQTELAQQYGADSTDADLVREVLGHHGVQVTGVDLASRRIQVSGTAEQMAEAFRTELSRATSPDPATGVPVEHRHRVGPLQVPAALDGVVVAVLGLDDRPQARPRLRHARAEARRISYKPTQLANVYRFPPGTDGSGQTLALVELGGGFRPAELETYFESLGLPMPRVTAVSVGTARNHPGEDADDEVLLDIEVAGALAPGAEQKVYFAHNTDQGFVAAVSQAVHATPTPTALSISWGAPEIFWTEQARLVFDEALADAAALGVTVCVAAGDDGSGDGVGDGLPHTDFPASSPHALACGGTRLDADPATGEVRNERVWGGGNGGGATGGGVSEAFGLPVWQNTAGVPRNGHAPGRGVPDVSGVADPETGYEVLVNGRRSVIGGTSAVAPLWAALTCRMVEALGQPLGMLHPLLYDGVTPGHTSRGFRQIIEGSNGAFRAGRGWNACTGLGVPDGQELLASLRQLTAH